MPAAAVGGWRASLQHRVAAIDLPAVVAVAIPVLVVLVLLVPFADVDPIGGVTTSNSPFTDEAWTVQNARNWALFGTPATDEWTLWLVTLPFTVIDAVIFRLFGVGIVQARLVDIGCVAVTVGALGAGLRRPFGDVPAFVAAIAYGTSSLVLYYGRMAYLEPMAGMFLAIGTLSLLAVDGSRPGRWGLIGGIALALAAGTKLTVLPGAIAVLVVALAGAIWSPAARRWVTAAGTTLAAAIVAWIVGVGIPNRDAVANVVDKIYPTAQSLTLRSLLGRVLRDPLSNERTIWYTTPLLIAAAGGWIVSVQAIRRYTLGTRLLLVASFVGYVVSAGAVILRVGGANRYLVFAIPWLAILSAPLVGAILRRVVRRAASGEELARRRRRWAVGIGLAVIVAAQGIWLHASWMRGATRDLVAVQAEVASRLRPGAVVSGGFAPTLAMTSRAKTVIACCHLPYVNAGDLYLTAGTRYWADAATPRWAAAHPAAWDARSPLACLDWTNARQTVCLFDLP